jgi:hypothetical protein
MWRSPARPGAEVEGPKGRRRGDERVARRVVTQAQPRPPSGIATPRLAYVETCALRGAVAVDLAVEEDRFGAKEHLDRERVGGGSLARAALFRR